MDKKDLFDALDDFSQTLLVTLAEVEAVKKNLKSLRKLYYDGFHVCTDF